MPPQGFLRVTSRAVMRICCSGRQPASVAAPSLPRQAKVSSIAASPRRRAASAPARSAQRTWKRWPGASGVSSGVARTSAAAANQRAGSTPTRCSTRPFGRTLKRSSAASSSLSWAATCAAGGASSAPPRARRRSHCFAPVATPHSRRHGARPSSTSLGRHQARLLRGPAHDRALEGLQRGDVADADVAVAVALAPEAVGVAGTHERDQRDDAEQHRHDGQARRDRAVEQRDGAPLSHRASARAGRR